MIFLNGNYHPTIYFQTKTKRLIKYSSKYFTDGCWKKDGSDVTYGCSGLKVILPYELLEWYDDL